MYLAGSQQRAPALMKRPDAPGIPGPVIKAQSTAARPTPAAPSRYSPPPTGNSQRGVNSYSSYQSQYEDATGQYAAAQQHYVAPGQSPGHYHSEMQWDGPDSIAPQGYQGYRVDGSAEKSVDAPLKVDMNDFPNYQQARRGEYEQIARSIAPQLLGGDLPRSPSRSGSNDIGFLDGPQDVPHFSLKSAPHAQRSAAPPLPSPSQDSSSKSFLGTASSVDHDTSLIKSEADKIAQRLLKTEKELERLKKQGNLIGESLRKQKALDLESPLRSVSTNIPAIPSARKPSPKFSPRTEFPTTMSISPTVAAWVPPKAIESIPPMPEGPSATQVGSMNLDQKSTPKSTSPLVSAGKPEISPEPMALPTLPTKSPAPQPTSPASTPAPPTPQRSLPEKPPVPQLTSPTAKTPQSSLPEKSEVPELRKSPEKPPDSQVTEQPPVIQQKKAAVAQRGAAPHLAYPMPPENKKPDIASLNNIPDHPALKNQQLQKSIVDSEQAKQLGLPPGTMWFDPTDPAQMQMIKEQLEGNPKPADPASPPKPKGPRKTKLIKEEDVVSFKKALFVPEDVESQAQVMRRYKRMAPAAHPSVTGDKEATELKKLTDACHACLAEIRSKSTAKVGELGTIGEEDEEEEMASPVKQSDSNAAEGYVSIEDVDALEFYDEIFFHKTKHAQLKVKMGVSIEDLVLGHTAGCV